MADAVTTQDFDISRRLFSQTLHDSGGQAPDDAVAQTVHSMPAASSVGAQQHQASATVYGKRRGDPESSRVVRLVPEELGAVSSATVIDSSVLGWHAQRDSSFTADSAADELAHSDHVHDHENTSAHGRVTTGCERNEQSCLDAEQHDQSTEASPLFAIHPSGVVGETAGVENDNKADARNAPPTQTETRQCRICFGDASDEPALGRLISPCRCRGTIKYVHLECLNMWRRHAAGSSAAIGATPVSAPAYYKCSQCGFEYAFRRTRIAMWISGTLAQVLFTMMAFALALMIGGVLMKAILVWTGMLDDLFDPTLDGYTIAAEPPVYPGTEPSDSRSDAADDFDIEAWVDWFGDWLFPPQQVIHLHPLIIDRIHFAFGFLLLGLFGFVQFLFTAAMVGPIPLGFHHARRGNPNIRIRPNAAGGTEAAGVIGVLIAFAVVIGSVRAVVEIWRAVRRAVAWQLERVGAVVFDIADEQDDAATQ